jgi:predicted outer membrane repeat protein
MRTAHPEAAIIRIQKGIERKTNIGGILNNRSNGTTFINAANFINSSAGDKGGAICVDSRSVSIQGSGPRFEHGAAAEQWRSDPDNRPGYG